MADRLVLDKKGDDNPEEGCSDSRRVVGRTESPVGEAEGWSSPDKTDKVSNDDSASDKDDEEEDEDARRKNTKEDERATASAAKQQRKGKSYDYATKLNYLFRDARFFVVKSNNSE